MTHWDKEHLDEGTLQAWLDRDRSGLGADVAAAIGRHLGECPRCAALLAEMEAVGGRTREILESGTPIDAEPPAYEEVLARTREGEPEESRRSGQSTRPRWIGLAWAASLVAALGVGWLASEMLRPDRVVLETPAVPESVTEQPPEPASTPVAAEGEAPEEEETEPPPEVMPARPATPTVAAADVVEPDTAGESPAVAQAGERPAREEGSAGEVIVRGVVTDGATGEPLAGAQIYVPNSGRGTLSLEDGTFALSLSPSYRSAPPAGEIPLRAELIGYDAEDLAVAPGDTDTVLAGFQLQAEAVALGQVVVEADRKSPSPAGPVADSLAREPVVWTPASPAEAEERVSFAPLAVPGIEILEIEVATLQGVPAVRVRQALRAGAVLTLVQRRDPESVTDRVSTESEGTFTIRRGELLISGSAPVPADSLTVLMRKVR